MLQSKTRCSLPSLSIFFINNNGLFSIIIPLIIQNLIKKNASPAERIKKDELLYFLRKYKKPTTETPAMATETAQYCFVKSLSFWV